VFGITRADKVLILVLIAIAALVWLTTRSTGTSASTEAVVERAGKEVLRLALSRPGLYRVPLPRGEAVVEISGGRVRMLPMPRDICPQGICSETGWISSPPQVIVCLPNLLTVHLIGTGEVDALVK